MRPAAAVAISAELIGVPLRVTPTSRSCKVFETVDLERNTERTTDALRAGQAAPPCEPGSKLKRQYAVRELAWKSAQRCWRGTLHDGALLIVAGAVALAHEDRSVPERHQAARVCADREQHTERVFPRSSD